ncbi:Fur family transcriptional regulator [Arenibacterium halophilum]|jgi:Fur family zinc uptake transcriptional regulator|uniref:Transcriptional repressor n=1 Tax=Arenibacterium halophilum TaxID=2583821 RepID=A0ABY2XDM2_9RHOB|nr:Fur family transcriptional regulator [Arenibacterium halophilum]TMV15074.1 transcriptional repressor [Arenibacterium halophilum]
MTDTGASPGFHRHDHAACISDTMRAVEAACAQNRWQLTPIRRRVLEILLAEHRALGAYDILEVLASEGQPAQPPVAYRALDFLVRHGFAHRIERLNAFAACTAPDHDHVPAFLICRDCKTVAESTTELSQGRLGQAARDSDFTIERVVVEAEGLCPRCRDTAGAAS